MTDTPVETPIVVHATPTQPQIEAGIRQSVLVLGTVAAMAGQAKIAGQANDLLAIAGPVAALLAFVWGQLATRRHAKQAATMAQALPDRIASVKP